MAALIVAGLMLVGASSPAQAQATFTVTNATDANNTCDAGCSLREAITAANANPGADRINFNIGGAAGVKTISPTSRLSQITDPVIIDGYSQPGATENTQLVGTDANLLVELDGSKAVSANGLEIGAGNVEVQGLVINDFGGSGIVISATGAKVEGNFIGTDPSGTQDQGNGLAGVAVNGSGNTVGGAPRVAHNLISGNFFGVFIGESDNRVLGNLIGTRKDGKGPLGNTGEGVLIDGPANNTIGGTVLGMPNTIAFNGTDGVTVSESFAEGDAVGNRISANSIFANGGLGIDLGHENVGNSGPTANDAGDGDAGPNNLQNKPAIASVVTSSGKTIIKGKLSSKPTTAFTIQFFSNPRGENEGKKFIGEKVVATDASGEATFSFRPAAKVRKGVITATATNEVTGDTSEFSAPRRVVTQ